MFTTQEERDEAKLEKVQEISVDAIKDNPNNPFKIRQDDEMAQMIESISEYGVLNPLLVRPLEDGSYELVSGHRRTYAARQQNIEKLPCIVREFTDDEAAIIMVDSNLQREHILPSERAKAYKLKYDAIKRQTGRPPKKGAHNEPFLKSAEIIAKSEELSSGYVKKIIHLNELTEDLLNMVDEKKIPFNTAYELSFVPKELQTELLSVMEQEETVPSINQAQRIKKAAQDGKLDRNGMELVLQEEKPIDNKIVLKGEKIDKYFSKDLTPLQKEEIIFKALDMYFKKLERARHESER